MDHFLPVILFRRTKIIITSDQNFRDTYLLSVLAFFSVHEEGTICVRTTVYRLLEMPLVDQLCRTFGLNSLAIENRARQFPGSIFSALLLQEVHVAQVQFERPLTGSVMMEQLCIFPNPEKVSFSCFSVTVWCRFPNQTGKVEERF